MAIWTKYWNPQDQDLKHRLAEKFKYLRAQAKEECKNESVEFNSDTLDLGLKRYNKETIGCDIWKPSDLRRIPKIGKKALSKDIETYLNDVVAPHQNLVSLNALLGKPYGTW